MGDDRELLDFWFGNDLDSAEAAAERGRIWFEGGVEVDRQLRARFADLPDRAAAGALDGWRGQPRSALARVLALDQLPRNLFRGTVRAFAYDGLALEAAEAALAASRSSRGRRRRCDRRSRLGPTSRGVTGT